MTAIVVVSPHLDDAVMSCGGLLAAAVRRGERALVVTVFTEGEGHEERRAEDREAVRLLGAEPIHLGLVDAPERLGLARSHRALVEEAAVDGADRARVEDALDACFRERGIASDAPVLAPLGAGRHVDHRVVHEALAARPGVIFYEDRPYSLVPGEVRARLREVGLEIAPEAAFTHANADLRAVPPPDLLRGAMRALPHLRAYLEPGVEGERSRAWIEARVSAERASASGPRLRGLVEPRVTTFDGAVGATAERAIAAYASQHTIVPAPALRPAPRSERVFVTRAARDAASPH